MPFTETFDDPTLSRWEHSPNATVVDGALHIGPDGFAFHPARWSDMSLAVRVRLLGEGELLIRYRWSEDANYSVRLRPDLVTVQKQLLGPPQDLDDAPASIPPGEWVEVTVMVTGGTHQVSLNGSPVLTATDPDPLPEGGVGFLVQGEAAGEFDSLEVTADGQATPPAEATLTPEPTSSPPPPISRAGVPAYQAASWVHLGGPPGGLGYDIRYKFDDPSTWYVTDAYTGFFFSHDRGLTWEPSNEGIASLEGTTIVPIFSTTVDPHNPDVIWIGTQFSGHIYKSTDSGLTWTQMDNGVEPNQGHSFRGFTIDPRSSDVVYAAAEVEAHIFRDTGRMPDARDGRQGGRVYRTVDGGQNWELIWEGLALARYIWIDPTDPDVLYVSTGFFDRSPLNEPENPIATDSGGIGILKSTDGGRTWLELGHEHGIENLQISSLYMKPDDPQTLLAGGGTASVPPVLVDGVETEHGGVYLTTDGGETWQAVVENVVITAVEYCDKNPQIAYAGGARAVYRSEDGGHTWQRFGDDARGTWGPPGLIPGVPVDIQVDPDDCNRVFINNYVGGNFLSTDGGQTWVVATRGYSGAAPTRVIVDPDDPRHVFAASRMAAFVSH
ncbi:MAG: family 16 glycoside hydrolase, partial [Dehalococcoidia bacterium]